MLYRVRVGGGHPFRKAKICNMVAVATQSSSALCSVDCGASAQEYNRNVSKLCQDSRLKDALQILDHMVEQGICPTIKTYCSLLQACIRMKTLAEGKRVHAHMHRSGCDANILLGNILLNMYCKCGSVSDAHHFFDMMPKHDMYSWTTIISAYAKLGQGLVALNLFQQMQRSGILPDKFVFVAILKACANLAALEMGKQIHAYIVESGCDSGIFVGNALIDMYAKCGGIEDALKVFNNMPKRDEISWNIMMSAYVQQGHVKEALAVFEQMLQKDVKPNKVTFLSALKACANLGAVKWGRQVHIHINRSGFQSDAFVQSTLVDMYAKCGSIKEAQEVFSKMHQQDVVSWTAMIGGYAQQGYELEALSMFEHMQKEGVKPNSITFVTILKACASLGALERGKQVHAHIIKSGFELEVFVGSSLIDMYMKCGSLEDAHQVFSKMHKRNVVSWTAMITGYVQHQYGEEAFLLFEKMQQEGVKPNNVTFVSVLKACSCMTSLEQGKKVHSHIVESGYESNLSVGSALIDMYAKCGSIEEAHRVFCKLPVRDAVSWTALIAGYVQQGHSKEALRLYQQMQWEAVKPDSVTFVSVLKACSNSAALEQGKQIHAHAVKSGFESDVSVRNALVDMYAKCGNLEDAQQVFDSMSERNVVSWTAIIAGYAQQGHGEEALSCFQQMQHEGVKPNNITFVSVLAACSHAGLVDEGLHQFNSMTQDHCIIPTMEHYACIVSLLGRAGRLDEAEYFVSKMPVQPIVDVRTALLGACRSRGNMELGKCSFYWVLELEPTHSSAFVLMSNIYAAVGRWDEAAKLRKDMEEAGVKEDWTEVNNELHVFSASRYNLKQIETG